MTSDVSEDEATARRLRRFIASVAFALMAANAWLCVSDFIHSSLNWGTALIDSLVLFAAFVLARLLYSLRLSRKQDYPPGDPIIGYIMMAAVWTGVLMTIVVYSVADDSPSLMWLTFCFGVFLSTYIACNAEII